MSGALPDVRLPAPLQAAWRTSDTSLLACLSWPGLPRAAGLVYALCSLACVLCRPHLSFYLYLLSGFGLFSRWSAGSVNMQTMLQECPWPVSGMSWELSGSSLNNKRAGDASKPSSLRAWTRNYMCLCPLYRISLIPPYSVFTF